MAKRECSIDDCDRPEHARTWCKKHYERWARNGDPNVVLVHQSAESALAARTSRSGECLIWTGCTDWDGYGVLKAGGITRKAHRAAWEVEFGKVPPGKVIDHTCFNPACVNTGHLRLASISENARNRSGATRLSKSGIRGVRWDRGKWRVSIGYGGKTYNLGRFDDKAEAERVAIAEREKIFGGFAGGSRGGGPDRKES